MTTTAATKPRLLLLTRPDCHLCEEFRAALEAAFPDKFDVVAADVDSKPVWQRRYGLKIPVLLDADGEVLCETRFDADKVRSLV